MTRTFYWSTAVVGLLMGCGAPREEASPGHADAVAETEADAAPETSIANDAFLDGDAAPIAETGEQIFRRTCIACHTIGGGITRRGPDLKGTFTRHEPSWIRKWIEDPAAMAKTDDTAKALVSSWGYVMPSFGLTFDQSRLVMQFIRQQEAAGPLVQRAPVALSPSEFDEAKRTYFDRCAGCHGTYRKGATGPAIGETESKKNGTETLVALMNYGTPRGMPGWGKEGVLSADRIEKLAAFLQLPPPTAPALPLDDIKKSLELVVPASSRPTAPKHTRDWENFFGVVLRDPGKVAIFDGDTKEQLATIDVGFAAHILRSSSTGRYFYAVGRDGRVTMIDLWTDPPSAVARVQGCYDARSVESSKFAGHEDRWVVEGCYWPPQYVAFDGQTLEPKALGSVLSPSIDGGDPLEEVRVASIVASPFASLWALSLKESGYVGLVDYSKPDFPMIAKIPAERFLHDGGWDHTRRYFLVAANARDKMAVIDVQDRKLVTTFVTGKTPHPGRGANWLDPTYGWVNATTHLGEGKLSIYGADPVGKPEHAWKVVRTVALPASGGLFLKTHEKSPWVLFDMPMASDATAARQICAYSKSTGAIDRCLTPSTAGPAVHFEFDRHGKEIWVSVWSDPGEIVVYDAVTLAEKKRITGVRTPTGKFNVYNTAHDVY